jgi:transcriptional regulator with XRE-family HTH domain
MKLTQYLSEKDLSAPAFAERAGLDASTIWRIVTGRVQPDLSTIAKICAAADGAVTPNDFLHAPAGAEHQKAAE